MCEEGDRGYLRRTIVSVHGGDHDRPSVGRSVLDEDGEDLRVESHHDVNGNRSQ